MSSPFLSTRSRNCYCPNCKCTISVWSRWVPVSSFSLSAPEGLWRLAESHIHSAGSRSKVPRATFNQELTEMTMEINQLLIFVGMVHKHILHPISQGSVILWTWTEFYLSYLRYWHTIVNKVLLQFLFLWGHWLRPVFISDFSNLNILYFCLV